MLENPTENKTFKYLVLGLVIVGLIIIVKEFILAPKSLEIPEFQPLLSEISIDFNTLESAELQELMLSEELSPPEEFGRNNPFENY